MAVWSAPGLGFWPAELFSHHPAPRLLQLANTLYRAAARRRWQLLVTAHGHGLSTELTPATKGFAAELLGGRAVAGAAAGLLMNCLDGGVRRIALAAAAAQGGPRIRRELSVGRPLRRKTPMRSAFRL